MGITLEDIRLPEMDTRVLVGKEMIAGDRTIWPVMRISILKTCEDRILAIRITPLAMLVIEPTMEYAISFDGEPMTVEAVIELAASLRDVLEKARGSARIRID
ncbi:MAG: hypothetical protein NTU95_03005 [Methanothrix sp.]|nr:hypothetical protein [Methanothrix sp.]